MKIIILGAGQVGGTLAENLAGENNDITIVDTDSERLRELQDKFDLRVVNGHGAHPRVLREAGAQDADMLVAVTNSDETNMVACQVAYSLFNTPNKVARIRSPAYLVERDRLFLPESVPVDHLIAPEQLVTDLHFLLIKTARIKATISALKDEMLQLIAHSSRSTCPAEPPPLAL